MLKNTTSSPDETHIQNMINKNDGYIWIRNNFKNDKNNKLRDLDYLANNINKLKNKIMLIIGDGDDSFPSSYHLSTINKLLNCDFINNIYAQNYDKSIIHKKIHHYPIGLDLHSPKFLLDFNQEDKIKYYEDIRKSRTEYIADKIFCDSYLSKTHSDRDKMYQKIKKNRKIIFLQEKLDFKKIIVKYRKYKFIISPRGNGLDCHRTWELFLLGCIVIMESSPLDDMWINNNLPVVILKDYNELNDNLSEKLKTWYKKYNKLTHINNIMPKFKNSYWLKND